MSQTGGESVCEKKKIQAQQKQIEAEKNEKKVANEKDTLNEKITAKQLKMNAHELNQKESEEVIESLNKRKTSVESDSSAGNQQQIIDTIKGEIETEQGRANEEKKSKEDLGNEI
jgi:predicted  nucleic acid-binding Zn-ribbon protein